MRVFLLLLLVSLPALADEHFYLERPHSGIELVCIGDQAPQCRVSQSVDSETTASKPVEAKDADRLFARFQGQLKKIPPGKSKSSPLRWNMSYRGFQKKAAAGSDEITAATLMGIEAELKKRLQ